MDLIVAVKKKRNAGAARNNTLHQNSRTIAIAKTKWIVLAQNEKYSFVTAAVACTKKCALAVKL